MTTRTRQPGSRGGGEARRGALRPLRPRARQRCHQSVRSRDGRTRSGVARNAGPAPGVEEPLTALLVLLNQIELWIVFWKTNQQIVQRTLGKSKVFHKPYG